MRVDLVTGTRAEFGILRPLAIELQKSPKFEARLLVTGMHLLHDFGQTSKEIDESGLSRVEKVRMYGKDPKSCTYYSMALATGIKSMTDAFEADRPDTVIVLGDRLEPLAATLSAAAQRIAIAHIHGGDRTMGGHIDDQVRNAITAFSHVHFAATRASASRLLKMGEDPKRVHVVGALGLDSLLAAPKVPARELSAKLGVDLGNPTAICVFHPLSSEADRSGVQMREILKALRSNGIQTVVLMPNNDPGFQAIISEIDAVRSDERIKCFNNLDHTDYVNLMRYASFMVGNSSSGLIEAPTLGLPFINVGRRQEGRESGDNVVNVAPKAEEISAAIRAILIDQRSKGRRSMYESPYGDGKTSERIRRILENLIIDDALLCKTLTY